MPDYIGAVCWYGPDVPYTTCYVPFYAGVTELPKAYCTGSTGTFDRKIAWWAFNFTANWACLKYCYMIKDILAKQTEIENNEFEEQPGEIEKIKKLYKKDPKKALKHLTGYCKTNADKVVKEWLELSEMLIQKYTDGYINQPDIATEVGYPKWWLEKVGYFNGPVSYKKPESEGGTNEKN
jgi:dipeptidase